MTLTDKAFDVVCLRPEMDFLKVGVQPPKELSIIYISPDDKNLPVLVKQARAIVLPAVGPKLKGDLFEGSSVQLVQVTGAGVDRVDEAIMKKLGIAVANVAGGSNSALAEYVLGCALVLHRQIVWADREIRSGNYVDFRKKMIANNLRGLVGLTVGIIGLGNIGLAVARAFRNIGCELVYFDPAVPLSKNADEIDARSVTLNELLNVSDVVSIHVPLLPETEGLIGAVELGQMKSDAVLINASRGGVVDESALAMSLTKAQLGAAAVDVYSDEPPSDTNPLFSLEGEAAQRVLFTPHIAGVTRQAWAYLFETAWDNVVRVLSRGETAINRVY
ncbi:MAG: hydroxyacid dehydrogenase [Rhodospirillaceae bacterium]|nr:hydroxyacid dehydrogenase [Rhodospirillaceae bacterium]